MSAATSAKKVFLIGPGFIGWNLLELLVKDNYEVTTLARRKDHAVQLQASGAKAVVIGSMDDRELLTDMTTKHDIIIHTASADHAASAEAVCEGLKKRAAQGQNTIYLHTSGTSVIGDTVYGGKKSPQVFHDDKPDEVDSLPDDAPHRAIDLNILRTRDALGDRVKVAIVMPPLIYGYHPEHGRLSIQIPTLTRFALKHGYAGYVGEGEAVWSNVHVKDLVRGYRMILHHLEDTPADAPDVRANPYYFCESTGDNEVSWREIAALIGTSLHGAGRLADPTPRQIPKEQYDDIFGPEFTEAVMGLNSRSRANRVRALGWKPVAKSWSTSYVEDELPVILQEDISNFHGYGQAVAS